MSVTCHCNNRHVGIILGLIPVTTERLTFHLDSNLDGLYHIPDINLQNISNLNHLEYFALKQGYREGSSHLVFSDTTFQNLTNMRELHINIVTSNSDIEKITKYMKYLEVLNLTNTRQLSQAHLHGIFRYFGPSNLKTLALRSFQTPGVSGYSDTLNINLFFKETMSIEYLDLSTNMFGVIYPSIIAILPNLISLDISQNYLLSVNNNALIIELIAHPTLETLNMESQGVGLTNDNIPVTIASHNSKHLRENLHGDIPKYWFEYSIHCINTNNGGNFTISFTNKSAFCATIRCIGAAAPHILKGVPCEAFGDLRDNFDNSCPFFIRFPVTKSLRSLKANLINWISGITPKWSFDICIHHTSLQYISFGDNENWIGNNFMYGFWQLSAFTSSLPGLKTLNLNKDKLQCIPKGSLSNLQELNLSGNEIETDNSICAQYPNLRYLSIAQNKLTNISYHFLWLCQYLEDLDLSGNFLNLSSHPFHIGPMLKSINLENNKIDILPSNFTKQLQQILKHQKQYNIAHRLTVNINNNNLLCMCSYETIEFIHWFQSTEIVIAGREKLTCSSSQGELFLNDVDIEQLKSTCFPSNIKVIGFSIAVTICAVLLVVLIFAMYRYRWRLQFSMIKYYNGTCHRNTKSGSTIGDDKIPMKYDAFVSYCSDDRFWVHDCLMKTLESNLYGFKLCIHYRDFPLGEDITTVIVKSIKQSRQLVIVLSKCSITRPWCQLEFQVALSEAVRRGIKLVVIKLGNFTVDDTMDSSLAWVLDNHTYLEWKENVNAQKVFWFKLRQHLSGYAGGCCQFGSQKIDNKDISAFAECENELQPLIN